MSVAIRPAGPADAEAVAAVHAASWIHAYAAILPPPLLERLLREQDAGHWWLRFSEIDPPAFTLVVETRAGGVVGYALAGPARGPSGAAARRAARRGEVYALYLDPLVQRRGLGALLVAAVARVLMARGHQAGEIWALSANAPAQGFYRAMGARPLGTRTITLSGVPLPEQGFLWPSLAALARHEFPRTR